MEWFIKEMSNQIYKIMLRGKEYDVLVNDSCSPDTTIEFKYDNCTIIKDVYLADDITDEERYSILQNAIKNAIHEYNSKRYRKRLAKKGLN